MNSGEMETAMIKVEAVYKKMGGEESSTTSRQQSGTKSMSPFPFICSASAS